MASHRDEIDRLEALYAQNPAGRVFAHLAEAYRKAGELERARELLEQGLRRHPDYASAHVVLGRVHLDGGDSSAAEQAFGRVLDLDPHNLVALRAQGDIARGQGRRGEALQYYNDLAGLDPGDERVSAAIEELSAGDDEPETEPAERDAAEWASPMGEGVVGVSDAADEETGAPRRSADADPAEADEPDALHRSAASGGEDLVLDDPFADVYEADAAGSGADAAEFGADAAEAVGADAGGDGSSGPVMESAHDAESYAPAHGGMQDEESYAPSQSPDAEPSEGDQRGAEEYEPYEPEFLGMSRVSGGSAASASDDDTPADPLEAYGLTGTPDERADAEDAIAAWIRAGEAYEREEAEGAEPEAATRAEDSPETREMDLGVELEPTDIGAGFGSPASPAGEPPSQALPDEPDSSADATLPPPDEAFPDADTVPTEEMTLPPPDQTFPFEEASTAADPSGASGDAFALDQGAEPDAGLEPDESLPTEGLAPDDVAASEPFQLEDEAEPADTERAFPRAASQPDVAGEQDDVTLPGWDGEEGGAAADVGAEDREAAHAGAATDGGAVEADAGDMAEASGSGEADEPAAAEAERSVEPDRAEAPTAPEWVGEEDGEAAALPDVGPELVTETIGDLYARQGLHDLAADVYRKLLERRPDDEELQRKLNESESASGADDAPPARPEWSTVEETRVPPVSPGAVAASDQAEASALEGRPPEERGEELTGFTGEDGQATGVVDAEDLGLEPVAPEAVGAADQQGAGDPQGAVDTSDLGLEPVGGGDDLFAAPAERAEGARTSDEAPVEEVEAAWTGGSGHDEPGQSPFGWTDTEDPSPAAEESIGDYLSGLLGEGAATSSREPEVHSTPDHPPAVESAAEAGGGADEIDALFADVEPSDPPAEDAAATRDAPTAEEPDEIDALFDELGPPAGEPSSSGAGGESPAGDVGSSDAGAESSAGDTGSSDADGDDEDLEMFRDWLQSLKR